METSVFKETFSWAFKRSPFVALISALCGGIILYRTPQDNAMLVKFGKLGFVAFWAAVNFIILSFAIYLIKLIQGAIAKNQQQKQLAQERIRHNNKVANDYKKLANSLSVSDRALLRQFVETGNAHIQYGASTWFAPGTLMASSWVESAMVKDEEHEPIRVERSNAKGMSMPLLLHNVIDGKKEYWLKDDVYRAFKYLFDTTGKISDVD